MKEHSLSSGDIQMWPFLTTQLHISRVFVPSPPNAPQTFPFLPPRVLRSHERTHPSRQTNDAWNKRKTTAFVFCPCWHARNSTTLQSTPSPPLPAAFITGKRTEKYHRIFVSVSQTLLLNGSRDVLEGTFLSEPWRFAQGCSFENIAYNPMRKNKFLGYTRRRNFNFAGISLFYITRDSRRSFRIIAIETQEYSFSFALSTP